MLNTKSCKNNDDCNDNEICELKFEKDVKNGILKPKGRFCKKKEDFKNEIQNKNPIIYDKECNEDNDCESGLCEQQFNIEPYGKRCVKQKKKYGKSCYFNNECHETYRCVESYDPITKNYDGNKCLVYENYPETFIQGPIKSILPSKYSDREWETTKNSKFFLETGQINKKLKGRGILAFVVVLIIEMIADIFRRIGLFLFYIWSTIYKWVSWPFNKLIGKNLFSFSKRYEQNQENFQEIKANIKCDPKKAFTVSRKTILKIITIIIPPYGVFLHKGLRGISEIIICTIFTLMLYIPGIAYGFSVIDS